MTSEHQIEAPQIMPDTAQRDATLESLFAEVCQRNGERTALTLGDQSMSYSQLNYAANCVASTLRTNGADRGTIVAICLPRGFAMIAAMLGVIKSGAAYLPIDPGYPVARISETLIDAKPLVILTDHDLSQRIGWEPQQHVIVDDILGAHADTQPAFHPPTIDATDAAYVIYTSGSTGRPKGVVVSHRNVTRLLHQTERLFRFTTSDIWTMFHSFAFDFSVWEIWGCLLTGGRLVIVPFPVSRSPEEFHHLLVTERVTVLNQTPSAFALLDQVDTRTRGARFSLRLVIFGGEALTLGSLRGWFARHGDSRPTLVNMYGITETTVHVTHRRLIASDADETDSLLGQPLDDLQLYLLDEFLRPVANEDEGEICVGGAGVAVGYLNRPALTSERFVVDPLGEKGAKLYRSGDLARRRADGELVYLGRRDSQVKINGFRIELGEIEAALIAHPGVLQACVIARIDGTSAARLVAYYVAQDDSEPSVKDLRQSLEARLPSHMLPAFYQRLAVFPLTPNGKVDRTLLPAPYLPATSDYPAAVAGASSLENRIAAIWQRVLQTGEVNLDENFFDAGGTSLLLIAVRTGLQEQLNRQIPVMWLFEFTTIRALARKLSEHDNSACLQVASLSENAQKQRQALARARTARSAKS